MLSSLLESLKKIYFLHALHWLKNYEVQYFQADYMIDCHQLVPKIILLHWWSMYSDEIHLAEKSWVRFQGLFWIHCKLLCIKAISKAFSKCTTQYHAEARNRHAGLLKVLSLLRFSSRNENDTHVWRWSTSRGRLFNFYLIRHRILCTFIFSYTKLRRLIHVN